MKNIQLLYTIHGTHEHLNSFETVEEATQNIIDFYDNLGHQVPYFRMWEESNHITVIDFGSWTRFYKIFEGTIEEAMEYVEEQNKY